MNYKNYLTSQKWNVRKGLYFREHKKECSACGSGAQIHLHHTNYTVLDGNEEDNDLIPLCKLCHELFHDTYGVKRNLAKETLDFIKGKRTKKKKIKKKVNRVKQCMKCARVIKPSFTYCFKCYYN